MSALREATIVTGASHGIGRAIAARLAEDGQHVLNLDRVPPACGRDPAEHHSVDFQDVAAVRDTLATVLARYRVTRLVNNVGIVWTQSVADTSLENLDTTLAVHLRSTILCAQMVTPGMADVGFGRIVNISSRTLVGKEGRTTYGMAKGALAALTRSWGIEFARDGITVNAVAPGPVNTALFREGNPPGHPRTLELLRTVPMGRTAEPWEVAHAVASFLDRRASYITGQILFVCGGQTLGVQGA